MPKNLALWSQHRRDRSLRVFYLGDQRVEGNIQSERRTATWPGKTVYSAGLDTAPLRQYGLEVPTGKLQLTAFEDFSSPRPGWGDLWFSASRDQSERPRRPTSSTRTIGGGFQRMFWRS